MEGAAVWTSWWYRTTLPSVGSAPSSGLDGNTVSAPIAGALPWVNPAGGENSYLARLLVRADRPGTLILADRLWHNSGISSTTTTAQAITSPTWPARDRNGSTDGDGVFIAIEPSVQAANPAGIVNTTISYVNSTATGGTRTGTIDQSILTTNTLTTNAFVPFQLAAGDVGIRSISEITLGTSYVSGTLHLVAFRPIVTLPCSIISWNVADALSLGFPRIYDDSALWFLWYPTSSGADVVLYIEATIAQG